MELGLLDHVERRGEQRGKEQGKLEGQRELIRGQLEERFGVLPRKAVADLEALPHDRLMQLGRALLSAKSLHELGLGG